MSHNLGCLVGMHSEKEKGNLESTGIFHVRKACYLFKLTGWTAPRLVGNGQVWSKWYMPQTDGQVRPQP